MGAYKVKRNVLLDGAPPAFGTAPVVLTQREFIKDITGSTAFSLQSLAINPGNPLAFPWLSTIAARFEQYQFLGLIFEFRSTSADALNSTNTALGTVVMATNYDSYDSSFTNKQQMEAYQFSTSTKPSSHSIHPVECDPSKNTLHELYVRSGAPSGDQRFYDVGNFQIATVGMQAAATIGELWVSYKVKLIRPKLDTPTGDSTPVAGYTINTTDTSGNFTTLVPYNGNNSIVTAALAGTAANFYPTRPGNYIMNWIGTSASTLTLTAVLLGSATASNWYSDYAGVDSASTNSGAGTTTTGSYRFTTTSTNGTDGVRLSLGSSVVNRACLIITELPANLTVDESQDDEERKVAAITNTIARRLGITRFEPTEFKETRISRDYEVIGSSSSDPLELRERYRSTR